MNLHTFFIHFPIGLLMIYGVCELLRFQKVMLWPSWFYIKAFLAIMGAGSAVVAYQFGEIAEHTGKHDRQLLDFHVFFAGISVAVFGIMAAAYAVLLLEEWYPLRIPLWGTAVSTSRFLIGAFAILPAVVGLIAISLTGAFGSAMVHGPESDFVVSFVYHLFIAR